MEAEEVPEEDAEVPEISLSLLQQSLSSADVETRAEAARQISEFVAESYGEEGLRLGAALREAGVVAQLAGA